MALKATKSSSANNARSADEVKEKSPFFPIPPMKGDQVVYEWVGIRRDPEPENHGRMLAPTSLNIPTYDKVLGKDGTSEHDLRFFEREVWDTQQARMVPVYTEILMRRGYLVVSKYQRSLYEYLELSNFNASNANRNPEIEAIFKRVDMEGSKIKELEEMDKVDDAIARLRSITNTNKLIAFGRCLKVNVAQEVGAIKYDIRIRLKDNPSLIELLDTPLMLMKSRVNEALELGVLAYNPTNRDFSFRSSNSLQKVTAVPFGVTDESDWFSQWLMADTSGTYDILIAGIRKASGADFAEDSDIAEIPQLPGEKEENF